MVLKTNDIPSPEFLIIFSEMCRHYIRGYMVCSWGRCPPPSFSPLSSRSLVFPRHWEGMNRPHPRPPVLTPQLEGVPTERRRGKTQ